MSTYSGLTVADRRKLKSLYRRKTAGRVRLRDRVSIRRTIDFLTSEYKFDREDQSLVPVSTLEWSSTSFAFGEKRIVLLDVEQANAVSLLLAKNLLLERPIFPYVEFMIRASEAFHSSGQAGTALLVAKKANDRLRSYARAHGQLPYIPRPMAAKQSLFDGILADLVLPFVVGHELGHLTAGRSEHQSKEIDWVNAKYDEHRLEPGRFNEVKHERFLKPECVQKFDQQGKFQGDILLGTKFAKRFDHIRRLQLGEVHSDFWGLLALTNNAAAAQVEPELAATMVIGILEYSEMLMGLKRLMPRLPKRGSATNVTFEHSALGLRRFMLIEAIDAIRSNKLAVPDPVRAYWQSLSDQSMQRFQQSSASGELLSVSNRSTHIARGALLVSCLGQLPEAPTEEMIMNKWGPMAGNGFFLASCLKIPEHWFRIDQHHKWEPNERDETVPIGFGSAICDIANIVKKNATTQSAETYLSNKGLLEDKVMLDLIRHPRVQVFQRRLIGKWPHKIMSRL
jgi:hypothetical protein